MRILYGVVGEGMGHATRSCVILRHLVKSHDVQIVVSGRAHAVLAQDVPAARGARDRRAQHGLRGQRGAAAAHRARLLKKLPGVRRQLRDHDAAVGGVSSRARGQRLRVVRLSVREEARPAGAQHRQHADHQSLRSSTSTSRPRSRRAWQMAKAIVKAKLPHCDHYLITTFFFPPVRKERTVAVPADLARRACSTPPRSDGEHVLVYQTSDTFHDLVPTLQRLPGQFPRLRAQARRGARQRDAQGLLRGRLRARPGVGARGARRRRLLAHGRGGVPRQAHAVGAAQGAVRADAQCALPAEARLRRVPSRAVGGARSRRSSSARPSTRATSPRTSRIAIAPSSRQARRAHRRDRGSRAAWCRAAPSRTTTDRRVAVSGRGGASSVAAPAVGRRP